MKALVSGANGFLGSHLSEALLAHGHEVRGLVQTGTSLANLEGLEVETIGGDLTDFESLKKACKGCDVVFHLAAVVSDYGSWELFKKINVEGTKALIDAAAGAGAQRFVQMSSLAVHPFHGWLGANEWAPVEAGGNPYARSKIEAEAAVRGAHRDEKLEGVVVRPGFFPFGLRDRTSFARLADAMERGIYRQVGDGRARTCTAYAPNLAKGLVLAGTKEAAAGRTFVLSDDGAPTWGEINRKIAKGLGCRLPTVPVPAPLVRFAGDAMESAWRALGRKEAPPLTSYRVRVPLSDTHFSNQSARRLLGFDPRVGFDEGMAATIEWYKRAKAEGSL